MRPEKCTTTYQVDKSLAASDSTCEITKPPVWSLLDGLNPAPTLAPSNNLLSPHRGLLLQSRAHWEIPVTTCRRQLLKGRLTSCMQTILTSIPFQAYFAQPNVRLVSLLLANLLLGSTMVLPPVILVYSLWPIKLGPNLLWSQECRCCWMKFIQVCTIASWIRSSQFADRSIGRQQ